jgi:hypothetical protein
MAKKKEKKEKPLKVEDDSGPKGKHEGLSFLEVALKKSHDSKKDLESIMSGKAEPKSEITKSEGYESIEITPQLSSEIKKEVSYNDDSESSRIKIEVIEEGFLEEQVMGEKIESESMKKPIKTDMNLYENLSEFFNELFKSFDDRYSRWENSTGIILTILRKMRKLTKKNTEQLITSIEKLHQNIEDGLSDFEIKRNEIEKISGNNFINISKNFKKILGLLELQIQEYQLKKSVGELFIKPT